jgi:CheY-like chemotaxis protein
MSLAERKPAARSPRALIVEDDPDVMALLASHLRRLGCKVILAASGEEALDSVAAFPPDLAVIDIRLPGIDGRQLLDALRTDPATAKCLMVATTVLDPSDVGRSFDAELPKPFTRRDIERVLGPLMQRIEEREG